MINLKSKRKSCDKSQNDVAKEAGISQQYYSFIESGARGKKLPVPTAKRIASALGFDWEEFYESNQERKDG